MLVDGPIEPPLFLMFDFWLPLGIINSASDHKILCGTDIGKAGREGAGRRKEKYAAPIHL